MKLGALEAGGTKMVCAIGDETGRLFQRVSFPTLTPEETLPQMIEFYRGEGISALGIGCFGPLQLDKSREGYGSITTTPKLAWQHTPLLARFQEALGVPVAIDTDVNGAAYGEAMLGAGKGCRNLVYVTVGTGIGGGVYCEGQLVHGMLHPEVGHMMLRPRENDPAPRGFCPFHEGCLEGLASGPAIEMRWGKKGHELAENHPAWTLEAEYLSQMCVNLVTTLSPEKIILGGGVMHQSQLFPMVRARTKELLAGYLSTPELSGDLSTYITAPGLGDDAGITGALLLARDAVANTFQED